VEAFPAAGAAASPAAASPGAEGSPADGAADFPAEAPPGAADSDAGEPLARCSPVSAGELLLFTAKQTVFYKNQKVDLGILTFAV